MSEAAQLVAGVCATLGDSSSEESRLTPLVASRSEEEPSGGILLRHPLAERRRSLPAGPTASREVLLVNGDRSAVLLLEQILDAEGFGVTVAKDADSAVAHAQQNLPDLILIDGSRSEVDGLALAQRLAADEQTCFVPVLLLCGTDDLCLRVRNANLDSLDFLRKPCSPIELRARIDKSLSQATTKRRLRLTASVDELTGLGNLRCLRERLASEKSRLERHGVPMSVMMIDVDRLKDVNDRHGHAMGSEVLKAVAATLRSDTRETDTAVRYGGDEFVVMLPHTPLTAGSQFAQRVLGHARELRPQGLSVSLSIGIAGWQIENVGTGSIDELLAHADSAAYRAKRSGGNQICVYDIDLDTPVEIRTRP